MRAFIRQRGFLLSTGFICGAVLCWAFWPPSPLRKQTEARYEHAFKFLEGQNCLFSGLSIKVIEDKNSLRLSGTKQAPNTPAFELRMTFDKASVKEIEFWRDTKSTGSYPISKILAQSLQKADYLWETPTRYVHMSLRAIDSNPAGKFGLVLTLPEMDLPVGACFLAKKNGTVYYFTGAR